MDAFSLLYSKLLHANYIICQFGCIAFFHSFPNCLLAMFSFVVFSFVVSNRSFASV